MLSAKYAIPVVVAMVAGMANQINPAKINPQTPWMGFAAIRLCQDA